MSRYGIKPRSMKSIFSIGQLQVLFIVSVSETRILSEFYSDWHK